MTRGTIPAGITVEETIDIRAQTEGVYQAIADFRGMARWSPEFIRAWTRGRALTEGARFVGFNRRGLVPKLH